MTFNSRKPRTYGTTGQCSLCGCDSENNSCTNTDCRTHEWRSNRLTRGDRE